MGIVSDTFTRADNASLGASWTEIVGDWTIASNQAECNDDNGGTGYYARYDTDVGGSDMYTELVTNSTQANGNSNTGPAVRMRSGATTSYQFATNLNDNCAFWRVVGGSETQITTFTAAVAVGDTLRLEVIGATLRAKVNGAVVAFAQDTNISDGQRGGLNGYNNVGTDVVRVDNFEAGLLTDDPPGGAYVINWGIHSEGTVTPRTPNLPTGPSVAAGDLVLAPCVVRDDTQTVSPDGTEGWSLVQTATQTGLEMALFAKVWGLGGQTDDASPEFSVTSATAGFGLVPMIVRNPAHATAPWTSVASAIVASAQQSNASSTTVTAPSVSYSGAHATVMRFYASADDNALGAPSAGALVFGGAAYDTAAGSDFAQACSVQEDITVTTSTGTATVTETVGGPDVSCGITIVIAIPTSGTTVGAVSEADALLAADRSGSITAGAVAETDALLAAARTSSKTVDSVAETDALQSVATSHSQVAAVLNVTDVLQAAQRSVSTSLALLGESDVLVAAGVQHDHLVSTLGELDALFAAQGLTPVAALAEADVLAAVGHQTDQAVSALAELDVLQDLAHSTERLAGLLTDVSALVEADASHDQTVGLVAEIDVLLAHIVVITDLQLTAGPLVSRRAAAQLTVRKRTIGPLIQGLQAGPLTQ